MIQRWKIFGNQAAAVTEPDGDYVEYADHLAAIAGKNKEIERMSGQFAKGFAAGMDCTLRRNPLYMNSPGDDVRSEAEVRRASDREAAQERRGAMGV